MNNHQFPQQKVRCADKPFSRELLQSLLDVVYAASPPFTGYLQIAGNGTSLYFLFFFNSAPYSAGRYVDGKTNRYSIREFGGHLASTADSSMSVTLCETDPVLLKNMLLFLQEEPDIKAPTSLIDIEFIVRQIAEVGTDAMVALCRSNNINFFFFWEGKAALAHYSDQTFERPEGMTVDEEMLLYAFQPGDKVQAFVYRDMITSTAEDSSQLDKESLFNLLTIGYPTNRRSEVAAPAGSPNHRRKGDRGTASPPGKDILLKKKLPSVVLSVVSGPLQGERFTVTLPCTIGRKDCDLVLDDRLVSRRHAELKIVENSLVIEDQASTNGTRVNGRTVTTKRLAPNDLISVGSATLRIFPA